MENQKQADERILNKIKKCLALSASGNEHEAAAAMRQAQKLMQEYNVSQSGLLRTEIGEAEVKSKTSTSRVNPWENLLFHTIAQAFGCRILWRKSPGSVYQMFGTFILVGEKQQVQMAEYAVVVLQRKLMKARADFVRQQPGWLTPKEKSARANGYCFGWVEAIRAQVQALANKPELEEAIRGYIMDKTGGKRFQAKKQATDLSARHQGAADAGRVSLHRPMNGREERVMIGN